MAELRVSQHLEQSNHWQCLSFTICQEVSDPISPFTVLMSMHVYFIRRNEPLVTSALQCVFLLRSQLQWYGPFTHDLGVIFSSIFSDEKETNLQKITRIKPSQTLKDFVSLPWTSVWPSVAVGWRWVCAGAGGPRWCLGCHHHSYQPQWRSASATWRHGGSRKVK